MEILSKYGVAGATTRAIAKRAGVNDSLIQRYFGSKEGLFLEFARLFQELSAEVEVDSSAPLEANLEAFFRSRLEFGRIQKKLLRVLVMQALTNKEFRLGALRFAENQSHNLCNHIKELQNRGHIDPLWDATQVSRFLYVVPVSLILLTEVIGSIDPEYAESMIRIGARLLARGLKPQ